jgi:putative hemolysin
MQPELHSQQVGQRILECKKSPNAYRARLAETPADVRAAQNLRFLVFNLELNEGLEQSYQTCLDADPFDDVCSHLLVEDTETGMVVGTYRLQTGLTAKAHLGYYSEQEFDFSPYEPLRPQMIELGRACVHIEHRNLVVLSLLWKGIADFARANSGHYLIGCSSLTSQDPELGAAMYSELMRRHLVAPELQTVPKPGWVCPMKTVKQGRVKVPKLLCAYLSLGAKICGAPALDPVFKTIDFLTFMDLDTLPPATIQKYLS